MRPICLVIANARYASYLLTYLYVPSPHRPTDARRDSNDLYRLHRPSKCLDMIATFELVPVTTL